MDGPWCHGAGSVPAQPPHSPPGLQKLPMSSPCLGTHYSSISLTFPFLCPSLPGVPYVADGTGSCFVTHHNLFLAPSPLSAILTLPSVPLHQWFVGSIAWIFGDEAASPSLTRLSSWHIPGAGLLAVLRGRAKAGGARGDQKEMLGQVWVVVGSFCAARAALPFSLFLHD